MNSVDVPDRNELTEDEHIRTVALLDAFDVDLAYAAAKVLSQFDEDVREYITAMIQDHTSLYSPRTADLISALTAVIDE